jgi:anti-sigma B factor antagonist
MPRHAEDRPRNALQALSDKVVELRRERFRRGPTMGLAKEPSRLREPESLYCELEPEREAVRLRPIGSLDMATLPVLERQLQELRDAGFPRLIIDLGGLSFMDSNGVRFALKWRATALRDGFQISFAPGRPAVHRVFELAGVTDHVPFVRS